MRAVELRERRSEITGGFNRVRLPRSYTLKKHGERVDDRTGCEWLMTMTIGVRFTHAMIVRREDERTTQPRAIRLSLMMIMMMVEQAVVSERAWNHVKGKREYKG